MANETILTREMLKAGSDRLEEFIATGRGPTNSLATVAETVYRAMEGRRQPNRVGTASAPQEAPPVHVTINPWSPLAAYLGEMAAMGLWGTAPSDVALTLIEEGARRALEKQLVPRKYFEVKD